MSDDLLFRSLLCELSRILQANVTDTWQVVQGEVDEILDALSPIRVRAQELKEKNEQLTVCMKLARKELKAAIETGLVDLFETECDRAQKSGDPETLKQWQSNAAQTLVDVRELLSAVERRLRGQTVTAAKEMKINVA